MPADSVIPVLLVDDFPLLHEGLVSILSRAEDIRIVGSATCAAEVAACASPVHVAVIDASLASTNGRDPGWLEAARAVQGAWPLAAVLLLLDGGSSVEMLAVADAGVAGFVQAVTHRDDFLRAVRVASTGRSVFTADQRRIISELRALRAAFEPLTPREQAICDLLRAGLRNKAIADQLNYSEKTIEHHVGTILGKYAAPSRTALLVQFGSLHDRSRYPAKQPAGSYALGC